MGQWLAFSSMKQLLLICAVVALVGCASTPSVKTPKPTTASWVSDPNDPNNVKIEKAIHKSLKYIGESPTGELTKADLEKVTSLELQGNQLTEVPKGLEKLTQLTMLKLGNNQLTDVKGLEKLTQLEDLWLEGNPDLTKAQIDQLKKASPKCDINSDHD